MKTFCSEDLIRFQKNLFWDIFHINFRLLLGNTMHGRYTDLVHNFDIPVSHMLKGVECDT